MGEMKGSSLETPPAPQISPAPQASPPMMAPRVDAHEGPQLRLRALSLRPVRPGLGAGASATTPWFDASPSAHLHLERTSGRSVGDRPLSVPSGGRIDPRDLTHLPTCDFGRGRCCVGCSMAANGWQQINAFTPPEWVPSERSHGRWGGVRGAPDQFRRPVSSRRGQAGPDRVRARVRSSHRLRVRPRRTHDLQARLSAPLRRRDPLQPKHEQDRVLGRPDHSGRLAREPPVGPDGDQPRRMGTDPTYAAPVPRTGADECGTTRAWHDTMKRR